VSKAAKPGGRKKKAPAGADRVRKAKAAGRKNKAAAPPPAVPDEDGATAAIMDRLWATVLSRRSADPATSHSARLLSRGTAKVAQKFGEEAVECLIEAVGKNPAALVAESADVLYHLIVMWVAAGVEPGEVWTELHRREGISGIAEKQARTPKVKKTPM
jgi:phosphoribosyl-ATP pyrophosphohydrolase